MARRGSNTGKGNQPASKVSLAFQTLKEGIAGAKKPAQPNKHLTTVEYKKGLEKVEEA